MNLRSLGLIILCFSGLALSAHGQDGAAEPEATADPETAATAEEVLSPEYMRLLQEAGVEFQQENFDAVLSKLDQMDSIRLDTPVALNLRGAVFTEKKEFDTAKGFFEKALAEEPEYFAPLFNLGEILFLQKKYAESRKHFESMLEKAPTEELLKYKIFMTYLMDDDSENAKIWRDKIQFPSNTPAYYFAQAAWEFKQDNEPEAVSWIESSMRIFGPQNNDFFLRSLLDVGFIKRDAAETGRASASPPSGAVDSISAGSGAN